MMFCALFCIVILVNWCHIYVTYVMLIADIDIDHWFIW